MQNSSSFMRISFLTLWAVFLSALTGVLGATPLRIIRNSAGQGMFWLIGLSLASVAIVFKWYSLGVIIGVQTLLVGSFAEFEEREFTLRQSATFAILLTALFLSSVVYGFFAIIGKSPMGQISQIISDLLNRAKEANVGFLKDIHVQDIVAQIPSFGIIFIILSLGLALVLEGWASRRSGIKSIRREKLSDFRATDVMIWFFIFSLLGTFGQSGVKAIEIISVNILNICAVVYFFQGLAVLCKYFEVFKITLFWKFLWVLILVVQLPIIMSLIGVLDYWIDFRKSFKKRAQTIRKKST
ncbi:MAG: hypothetical protein A2Z20_06005 [Bdellovibrionales bacterium RBG_16_40_8]|nr:MAG: hypothetical protein A2Z20_06005 [Bdellovibrionales bacterium RBG_16_40_8]